MRKRPLFYTTARLALPWLAFPYQASCAKPACCTDHDRNPIGAVRHRPLTGRGTRNGSFASPEGSHSAVISLHWTASGRYVMKRKLRMQAAWTWQGDLPRKVAAATTHLQPILAGWAYLVGGINFLLLLRLSLDLPTSPLKVVDEWKHADDDICLCLGR